MHEKKCKTSCEAVFQLFMSFIVVGFLIALAIERFTVEPFQHTYTSLIQFMAVTCSILVSFCIRWIWFFLLFCYFSVFPFRWNEWGWLSINRISRNIGERRLIHNQFWNVIIWKKKKKKNGSEYISAVSRLKIGPMLRTDWQNWSKFHQNVLFNWIFQPY